MPLFGLALGVCGAEVSLFFVPGGSHEVSSTVKNYISDILSALVQDAESLPQEVIDTILANILEPKKVTTLYILRGQTTCTSKPHPPHGSGCGFVGGLGYVVGL